jgi:hypothetical protein
MNDKTTREKIEIRLELRQLVLLSLGTMTFSGSLFAVGYWLGTRDGLKSAASPTAAVVSVDRTDRALVRPRVKPTKAALGEVEFLFAKPSSKKKVRREAKAVVTTIELKPETTVERRLPKLSARPKAVKPLRVVLPELPAVPGRLRTKPSSKPVTQRLQVSANPQKESKQVSAPVSELPARELNPAAVVKSPKVVASPKPVAPKITDLVSTIDAELREGTGANGVTKPDVSTVKAKTGRSSFIAVTVPKQPAVQTKTQVPSHYFTVQVKAVTDKGEADSFSASLRARGFKPNVVLANIPEKGRYYRIRVGKFESLDEARRFHKEIKAKSNSDVRGFVTRY